MAKPLSGDNAVLAYFGGTFGVRKEDIRGR
jgi:hypothetical protein